ncbi:hypothetical protein ACQ4PT_065675 [Festuca glaucescens]
MHDIWRILQWWDDWQLRILVLGSLGLQWFLLLAAPMRKFTIPHVCRTCIWLAYICSDALAIYALATLFNRHARASSNNLCGAAAAAAAKQSSRILEVLWAPILLIHLGGQKEMTGYEIEDNELWTRHTVTLVSQVAVALYAFCKSWPSASDWKLLAAAVLLFVVGVASFSEKPFALNRAKIKRLAAVSAWVQGTKPPSKWTERINQFFLFEESNCSSLSTPSTYSNSTADNLLPQPQPPQEEASGTGRRMQRRGWCGRKKDDKTKPVALSEADKVLMVLSDMSLLAAANDLVARNKALRVEDVLPPLTVAEKALPRWLRNAFAFIYTRATVVVTPLYLFYHLLVVPVLHMAALTLFATSDKYPYKRADVKITYIILCLTAALDVFAVFIRQLLYRLMSMTRVPALCETVPSYNLIDAAIREGDKSIGWMYKFADRMGFRDFNCFCICRPRFGELYGKVTQIVIADLVDARDRDLASYRIFDDSPADKDSKNWALSKDLQRHCGDEIRKSLLKVSFDRSVLLWHIATDLCDRCTIDVGADDGGGPGPDGGEDEAAAEEVVAGMEEPEEQRRHRIDPTLRLHRDCTIAISNYMLHLLNVNPEMLLTGSRHHLISEAVKEVNKFLLSNKKEDTLSQHIEGILRMEHMPVVGRDDDNHIFHIKEACKIAKELLQLPPATQWMLMYRVWLGMLCYSASMCRGYLHAKSLGEGGEFLSFVWLTLALKGAKSLADKLQMPPET